jgi:hypothetical protein
LTFSVVIVVSAAILSLAIAQVTKADPGDCSGIGFGCSLHGWDAAGFAAIFVIPAALAILVVGNVIIAVVASAARNSANRQNESARYDWR